MGLGTAVLQQPAGLSISEDVIKPRCDKLGYRVVKLPNELRVLLISDPETDKAAAALNVSGCRHARPNCLWMHLFWNDFVTVDEVAEACSTQSLLVVNCQQLHVPKPSTCPASRAAAATTPS
jgi:hypothetical protein